MTHKHMGDGDVRAGWGDGWREGDLVRADGEETAQLGYWLTDKTSQLVSHSYL